MRYRTLLISDIRLGSRAARADDPISFLRHHEADTIYLVGDMVDSWRLKRSWNLPQDCNDVVQKLPRWCRPVRARPGRRPMSEVPPGDLQKPAPARAA